MLASSLSYRCWSVKNRRASSAPKRSSFKDGERKACKHRQKFSPKTELERRKSIMMTIIMMMTMTTMMTEETTVKNDDINLLATDFFFSNFSTHCI